MNTISKIELYPKYCEIHQKYSNFSKGINEGWTNDDINICISCYKKDELWQADAKREWDLHDKNPNYEPDTYYTRWNIEELDSCYNNNGDLIDLDGVSTKELKDKYKLMNGDE